MNLKLIHQSKTYNYLLISEELQGRSNRTRLIHRFQHKETNEEKI